MQHKYYLGKVDYDHSGHKNCKAFFEWELKEGNSFSMSAEVWNPRETDIYMGGQCCDDVLKLVQFPTKQAKRMVEIWERWHLNDLRAGCEHQRELKWDDIRINPDELPKNCHANRDEKGALAVWIYPLNSPDNTLGSYEHKDGVLAKPCPVCGYKYGTKWLKEEIPQNIIDEIKSWG